MYAASRLILTLAVLALPLCAGVLDDSGGGVTKPAPSSTSSQVPVAGQSSVAASSANPNGQQTLTLKTKSLKPVPVTSSSNDPYDKLAQSLAQSSGSEGKINVCIGNFLDGETDQLSPRSTEVKEELAIALPKTGKFEIITRERLADLQNEGKFQTSDIVQTSGGSNQVVLKAVNGIHRIDQTRAVILILPTPRPTGQRDKVPLGEGERRLRRMLSGSEVEESQLLQAAGSRITGILS